MSNDALVLMLILVVTILFCIVWIQGRRITHNTQHIRSLAQTNLSLLESVMEIENRLRGGVWVKIKASKSEESGLFPPGLFDIRPSNPDAKK